MRIAYLNSQYPLLSHTFIEREVRAVRAAGVQVQTYSLRPPTAADVLSEDHREAARTTIYLREGWWPLVRAQAPALLRRPLTYLRMLWRAQRLAPPRLKGRALHVAYSFEGARLARAMRRAGLRHVHVHMANNGAAVALLATTYDRTLSYSLSVHGPADFFDVRQLSLKQKAQGAAFVRCISEFCRAQLMAWTDPSHWQRFHIVHCGVDPDAFTLRPAPERNGPLRLLTVGRMVPVKGYPLLLRACRELSNDGIDWRLTMVGQGPQVEPLQALARELGIAERIIFAGGVGQDDIGHYYDQADVMVVSSFMEGVPVVLMEAMAKGLAVVATRVAGIPELVDHGVCGWLVAPGSVTDLTAALAQAAAHRENLPQMGHRGRKRVLEGFTVAATGRGMVELWRRYTAGHAGSTALDAEGTETATRRTPEPAMESEGRRP